MQAPSAEEIWRQHQDKSAANFPIAGDVVYIKHEDADDSHCNQLESVNTQFREKISQYKVDKLGSLCIGEYDASTNTIIIKSVKGRVWSHYGYNDGEVMMLHPEEAYFLMDVGTLRVLMHGLPLSLQEAQHFFFTRDDKISFNDYLVYSHLNRLGYIVKRMKKVSEDNIKDRLTKRKTAASSSRLPQSRIFKHEAKHEPISETQNEPESELDILTETESTCMLPECKAEADAVLLDSKADSENILSMNPMETERGGTDTKINPTLLITHLEMESSPLESEPATTSLMSESETQPTMISDHKIDVNDITENLNHEGSSQDTSCLVLNVQENVTPKYTEFDYTDINLSGTEPASREGESEKLPRNLTSHFNYFSMMDYRDTKTTSTASNWSEFRDEHRKRLALEYGASEGKKTSLIDELPISGVSSDLSSVLNMLQLSRTVSFESLNKERERSCDRLIFDVYQPDPDFRKTKPGNPYYRVMVVEPSDKVPSLSDISFFSSAADGVPFYWAICDGGDISFYCQTQEYIQPDLYESIDKAERRRRKYMKSKLSEIKKSSA